MYWCYHCYAHNDCSTRFCARCGQSVEAPAELSYNERLCWTLGHPDGDRAVLAAQSLGARQARSALPALRKAVDENRDPFVAVAALHSAIVIAGVEELRSWLERLSESDGFMVRTVAHEALQERRTLG